ncbi:MAG: tRNA lysidine(34) synthetase TilS, partial [Thalassotalea sp.]|nr:tRNA lysidine(34) synthetase TilS [Thalassotalea sp.]
LRKEILPHLKERWPSFNQSVVRSTLHCQEAQQILDEVAEQDLTLCLIDKTTLVVPALMLLSKARFNQAIRFFIHQHKSLMPSKQQLQQLHQQLSSAEQDKTPEVKLGDVWLRRFQDKLYLTSEFQSVIEWQYDINLEGNDQAIELPDRLGHLSFDQEYISGNDEEAVQRLSLPDNIQSITLAFTHNNPKCLPDYRHQNRPLKKVLQELAIPPWQRKRLPLLFINNELAAVIGHFVCQPFMADAYPKKIIVHWLKESG